MLWADSLHLLVVLWQNHRAFPRALNGAISQATPPFGYQVPEVPPLWIESISRSSCVDSQASIWYVHELEIGIGCSEWCHLKHISHGNPCYRPLQTPVSQSHGAFRPPSIWLLRGCCRGRVIGLWLLFSLGNIFVQFLASWSRWPGFQWRSAGRIRA